MQDPECCHQTDLFQAEKRMRGREADRRSLIEATRSYQRPANSNESIDGRTQAEAFEGTLAGERSSKDLDRDCLSAEKGYSMSYKASKVLEQHEGTQDP